MTADVQAIRLDGSGFANGWEEPIRIAFFYDRQANRTAYTVGDGAQTDLAVSTSFDELNGATRIAA